MHLFLDNGNFQDRFLQHLQAQTTTTTTTTTKAPTYVIQTANYLIPTSNTYNTLTGAMNGCKASGLQLARIRFMDSVI